MRNKRNDDLIKEFMQWEDFPIFHGALPDVIDIDYTLKPEKNIRFDVLWLVLMPVVEKICSLELMEGVPQQEYFRTFGMQDLDKNFMVRLNGYSLHRNESFALAVYNSVIEYITQNK